MNKEQAKQEPRLGQEGDDLTIAYLVGYGKARERIAELEALNEDLYRQGVGFIARIAELEAALDVAHGVLEQIQRMGYSDVGDKMMVDEAIAKLKEVRK